MDIVRNSNLSYLYYKNKKMYKQASQLKLRFPTPKGLLSTEQLWDLSMSDLTETIKEVKKSFKKDDDNELSFLVEQSSTDKTAELQFNILKDVYLTRKEAAKEAEIKLEKKARNQKILEELARRQDEAYLKMSDDKLMELLKD